MQPYHNPIADKHHREVQSVLCSEDRLSHIRQVEDSLLASERDECPEDVDCVGDHLADGKQHHDHGGDNHGPVVRIVLCFSDNKDPNGRDELEDE